MTSPHRPGVQYAVAASTSGIEKTGHIRVTVVTLGHDVVDMDEAIRVDLADHPLYAELQAYVKANPR